MERIEYSGDPNRVGDMREFLKYLKKGERGISGTELRRRAEKAKEERSKEIRSYTPGEKTQEAKVTKALEQRSTLTACLSSMVRGKGVPLDASIFNSEAEEIFMRSGITNGCGLHLALESRYISAKNVPIASFIAKYNKAIRDRNVLTPLGVTFLTGLTGRAILPNYSGSSTTWGGETESAKNGKGLFTKKELTPKRITTRISVSRQLLLQNGDIDDFLAADLAEAVTNALETAVFGKHEHKDHMPDGFFTGKTISPVTGDVVALLALEGGIKNNGQPMAYCMRSDVERKLKISPRGQTTAVFAGMCNDYKYVSTDTLPKFGDNEDAGGIIFGRWSDLLIAQWGAIEILFNPYTQAEEGLVEFIVNAYYDVTYRPESFAITALK